MIRKTEIITCSNFKCREPLMKFERDEELFKKDKEVILTAIPDTMQIISIDEIECPNCGTTRDLSNIIELLGKY